MCMENKNIFRYFSLTIDVVFLNYPFIHYIKYEFLCKNILWMN